MGMDASQFGLWAGTAINSSVVAAGAEITEVEAKSATIVKLTRALMIVPDILYLSLVEARRMKQEDKARSMEENRANVYHLVHGRSHHYKCGLVPTSAAPYHKISI